MSTILMQVRVTALLVLLASGCALPQSGRFEAPAASGARTVYVASHGWHTGLVVRRDDIPKGLLPESDDFPDATYLEVGWGDEGFYRAKKITLGISLRAIFLPTPGVLHVVGFDRPVEEYFPHSDVVEVSMSNDGFEQLCRFIHDTYLRDENGDSIRLGPGIYGASSFYRSGGKYYFPKTCNVWTARALRAGGLPLRPARAVTAGGVIQQARRLPGPQQPVAVQAQL